MIGTTGVSLLVSLSVTGCLSWSPQDKRNIIDEKKNAASRVDLIFFIER
jgi:hypothetical protein